MQWSLFVLIVTGQCSFFLCRMYEYHFINKNKTWEQAQNYCRKHHTDLAIVNDTTDMNRLNHSENQNGTWIGLYFNPHADLTWHWSLPGVEYNNDTKWASGEPNNNNDNENCVVVNENCQWMDFPCEEQKTFICYDINQSSSIIVDKTTTWLHAQSYCRENHTDLISGHKQLKNLSNHQAQNIDNHQVCNNGNHQARSWIGLFRDRWWWSDGSSFSFRNWDPNLFVAQRGSCAVTLSNGKWNNTKCDEKKPFFCYNDNVILIKENKTWEEALNYCRDNHRDLVSITNLDEQRWVQSRAKQANSPYVWLGLRYTCVLGFWFWVTDEVVSYKNWDPHFTNECDHSGAMSTGQQPKWFSKHDDSAYNFICFK